MCPSACLSVCMFIPFFFLFVCLLVDMLMFDFQRRLYTVTLCRQQLHVGSLNSFGYIVTLTNRRLDGINREKKGKSIKLLLVLLLLLLLLLFLLTLILHYYV